jgi:hypothetical protein
LTRLDTGQRCSTSFAAGLSNVDPPSLSQDAKSVDSRTTGMRSWTSATKSGDLRALAERGYEGAASTDHDQQAQAVGLFLTDSLLEIWPTGSLSQRQP